MTIGPDLRARAPRAAARSAVLILVVSAAVLAGFTVFQAPVPGSLEHVAPWAGVGLLLVVAAACAWLPHEVLDRFRVGTIVPLVGVGMVCGLNLLTADTSTAAQAFLAFPVLWAASHLRTGAVVLVTGTAVVTDGATLFYLEPARAAAIDLLFFGAMLVVMAVMLVRANTVQEHLVAALKEQAMVDPLTGFATRRAFDRALESALVRSGSDGTALILIDVDAFKTINDVHGHPVGDDVLAHLASVLRGHVRGDDAVLSRLGGDELAVLLPGCSAEVARRRAQELLAAVRSSPMTLADGTLLALSISVGVAQLPQHSSDRRGLYTAADKALYDAKRAGRDRVAVACA